MKKLSKMQAKVLAKIELDKVQGIKSTYANLALFFGIHKNSLITHLDKLEMKGYIRRVRYSRKNISIQITNPLFSMKEQSVLIGDNFHERELEGVVL